MVVVCLLWFYTQSVVLMCIVRLVLCVAPE